MFNVRVEILPIGMITVRIAITSIKVCDFYVVGSFIVEPVTTKVDESVPSVNITAEAVVEQKEISTAVCI